MIKIENLQKNYNKFSLHCSLEVKAGRITGLIGPNGAGKSTTFKAVLGLISIDGGTIELFGKEAAKSMKEEKEKIGVTLSDSGFSNWFTIKDILPILSNMYQHFQKEFFLQKCEELGLPLIKKLKEFSTGMKAKLKVIIALSHEASLLILDEPTAGLDVVAREQVLDMLRSYMEEKEDRAILISSHISSDLENLCDDIYMIQNGEIVLHEETDVLLSNYAVLKVDEKQYEALEKKYLLKTKQEKFGYKCLTNQRQFYQENYPEMVIEKGSIDELIMIMMQGKQETV